MLNRDQQNLLGALGSAMAADALLDSLREHGTLEGGRSARQEGCWINYNRKAVWLEDHSGFSEAMKAAGTDTEAWRSIRPRVVLKVTWAEAAAYGASLPKELRTELDTLRRTERDETRRWSEYSDERGGWPHRRRFDSDKEHQVVQTEWDPVYGRHLVVLRDVWDRQKAAIARALPLTVDDEPVDLLELLDQQPSAPAAPTQAAAMQAGSLRAAATAPAPSTAPDEGLFTLKSTDPSLGR
jgi:hypothetical protein